MAQLNDLIVTGRASFLNEIKGKIDWTNILSKPTIPAAVAVKGNAETSYRTGNVNITPANIGLGNVGNFKAVSTVASQGLTSTEQSNARGNIGAGTSNLTIGTSATTAMAGNTNVNNVTQTETTVTSDTEYELLFSNTADNTNRTEGTRKSSLLTFSPEPAGVQLTMNYDGSRPNNYGDITINGNNNSDSYIALHSSSAGMSYMWIKHPTPGVGIFLEGGSDSSSEYIKGTINTDDFIVSGYDWEGNNITWDGTNTSLKAAVTAAKDTVKQTNTSTGSSEYKLLFSGTADSTDRTEGVRKHGALGYAPGDNMLSLYNNAFTTVIRLQANDSPSLFIKDSSTKKLTLTNTDITLTDTTWDGTNTSLKAAVTNAKGTVTQTETTTNANYELLFSGTADDTTRTEGAGKSSKLKFNPSTSSLIVIAPKSKATLTPDQLTISNASGGQSSLAQGSLVLSHSGVSTTYSYNDIVTDSHHTWDGTNTSLKTALANKISKETNTTVSWTSSATGRTVTCMLAKIGTIVICTITGSTDAKHSITPWSQTQLGAGQIPAGYRPSSAMEGRISTQTGGAVVTVNTVGTVAITTWSNLGNQMAFGGTFWWKTS